jgi:NitT/TauT family transport system ATP-binding protein
VIMTARPGRIKDDLRVSTPRPRDITSPAFGVLRKQALDLLSDEIARSMAQETAAGAVS